MAGATGRKMEEFSDDELPDLQTLLPPRSTTLLSTRRSPRKQAAGREEIPSSASVHVRKAESSTRRTASAKGQQTLAKCLSPSRHPVVALHDAPVVLRPNPANATSITSNNGLSKSPMQRSLKLTHVDSLLLPLSQIAVAGHANVARPEREEQTTARLPRKLGQRMRDSVRAHPSSQRKQSARAVSKKAKSITSCASQFVLEEARCNDDSEDSRVEDGEDEETDLSGFIVSDEAELTVYESGSESEVDVENRLRAQDRKGMLLRRSAGNSLQVKPLERDASGKEIMLEDDLVSAVQNLVIGNTTRQTSKTEIETVDLTSSPPSAPQPGLKHNSESSRNPKSAATKQKMAESSNPFDDFDAVLKFSPPPPPPPLPRAPAKVPTKVKPNTVAPTENKTKEPTMDSPCRSDRFTTPPATPPRSPSKLKSPSKLLSPSKNTNTIPRSPHRQSVDGFWDLDVVNTWHDTFSSKKAPLISPRKKALERFLIWSDSEEDDDQRPSSGTNDSSDSLPSPCSSPRKPASPAKKLENAEKMRLAAEKKAAMARKKAFDGVKEQVAIHLLQDLDANITCSKLAAMSLSTGGVKIIWSNSLRSTAGRANWKLSVTKPSGSPMKLTTPSPLVQHYASIELAAKIIDCESRLVNTLAHEFCHLANFMVSGVRDQPHGPSFKTWATKVTTYLQQHSNVMYRSVEVTTRHSYKIDHKYVWVCVGKPPTDTMRYLNLVADEGCGAEYGRHSKSINVETQRCGRCKGRLLQVKPKPRTVNTRPSSPRKALFGRKTEKLEEETAKEEKDGGSTEESTGSVELADLSD